MNLPTCLPANDSLPMVSYDYLMYPYVPNSNSLLSCLQKGQAWMKMDWACRQHRCPVSSSSRFLGASGRSNFQMCWRNFCWKAFSTWATRVVQQPKFQVMNNVSVWIIQRKALNQGVSKKFHIISCSRASGLKGAEACQCNQSQLCESACAKTPFWNILQQQTLAWPLWQHLLSQALIRNIMEYCRNIMLMNASLIARARAVLGPNSSKSTSIFCPWTQHEGQAQGSF